MGRGCEGPRVSQKSRVGWDYTRHQQGKKGVEDKVPTKRITLVPPEILACTWTGLPAGNPCLQVDQIPGIEVQECRLLVLPQPSPGSLPVPPGVSSSFLSLPHFGSSLAPSPCPTHSLYLNFLMTHDQSVTTVIEKCEAILSG